MPYIEQEIRQIHDPVISQLVKQLKQVPKEKRVGELNYIISKLLLGSFSENWSYADFNAVAGVLSCVDKEFYRRFTAPYEDAKITLNGDIV